MFDRAVEQDGGRQQTRGAVELARRLGRLVRRQARRREACERVAPERFRVTDLAAETIEDGARVRLRRRHRVPS